MLKLVVWSLYAIVLYISFFLLLIFLEKGGLHEEVEWREEWPSLSIVIPAFNEEETIGMTIESAANAEYPEDKKEIIVVNDGSTDNTREEANEYTDKENIKLLNQENQGKGGALNTGLDEAEGELYAVVDADSRLSNESLKNIVSEMDEDMAGIASAMKVYKPENLLQKVQWLEYNVGIFLRKIMGAVNAIHVTPGPLSIYRTEKLEDADGFDPKSLVEDQEICFRLQDQHDRIGNSRHGEVYTVAPKNLREFYNQRYRWYKGSLENIIEYKHMILNPSYGDFGLFGIPSKIAQGFLSILGLFLMTYYILNPIYNFLREFAAVGTAVLDFKFILSFAKFKDFVFWWVISHNYVSLLLLGIVFGFSVFVAYLASIYTEEELFENGYLPPFIYFFWYVYFIGIMWLISTYSVLKDAVTGREYRWKTK